MSWPPFTDEELAAKRAAREKEYQYQKAKFFILLSFLIVLIVNVGLLVWFL